MPFFEYVDTEPELAQAFNNAMTGATTVAIQSALPAYDFSSSKLIVDVGGGHGALLAAVLCQAPGARGVLFDLPAVVAGADATMTTTGIAARCGLQGGSSFESVPAGGDTYLLKTVIHDWDDEQSCAILRNVRSAITPGGKLLLFEMMLPEGAPAHLGLLLDSEMLTAAGGRERTRRQYAELLSNAGFELQRVVPTASPMSIVEARAV